MLQKFCSQKNLTKNELVLSREQLRKKRNGVRAIEMIVKKLLKKRKSADAIAKMIQLNVEREELRELNRTMNDLTKKLGMIDEDKNKIMNFEKSQSA